MVRGIDKFREFFTGYEGNYVIIGGTACEMHEEIYAQTPRATKDIDIILIVEALSSDFAAKFWEFVKTAGYRQRNKGTGNGECRHEYYRFKEPGNPDFPYQIELFSRNIGVVKFPDDAHITPIPVDDDLSSLSEMQGLFRNDRAEKQWRTSGQQTYRQAQERCIPAGCHACSCRHLRSS